MNTEDMKKIIPGFTMGMVRAVISHPFEMMKLKMPFKFNVPEQKVSTLSDIWYGHEIDMVRKKQNENNLGGIKICKKCPFKETYKWEKIEI